MDGPRGRMPGDEMVDRLMTGSTAPRGALKYDGQKERVDLTHPEVSLSVGRVMGFGAAKYGEGNYLKGGGLDTSRLYGAALRHMFEWRLGNTFDPESRLPHLAHAIASLSMIMEIEMMRANEGRS